MVVIYIGANKGDYFHFHDRKKERTEHFESEGMDFHTGKCDMISLDYYIPRDKRKSILSYQTKISLKVY